LNFPSKETIYEIGSITKTFTSMLLAQALIEKKVNLNDDIRKYLKGNYPNLSFKGKPIQLLYLANLTSGLPDNLPEKLPFKTNNHDSQLFELKMYHDNYSKFNFLTDLHYVKLIRESGLSSAHSNTAAQLLGFILENIYSGISYKDLLKKVILKPLNMSNTFYSVPDSLKKLYAKGYNDRGMLMPEIPKDAGSSGILKSTLPDMIKYINYQLKEKDNLTKLSHKITWGNLENYGVGLGWFLKTNFDKKKEIWSSGGTFGFSSYSVLYPEIDFAVVVLANESDQSAEDALSKIAHSIYNEVHFSALQRSSEGFGFSKSINLLVDTLNKIGFKDAIRVSDDLKKKYSSFKLIEDEVNNFGYHLLSKGNKEKALEIFRLNTDLFPKSSNTYDSLAETYESIGDKASAIKFYKRALELSPLSTNAAEHLKKLENK